MPYVSDGKDNATFRRDSHPKSCRMEEAVALLDARAARVPAKGKRGGKKARPAPDEKKPEKKAKAKTAPASGNGASKPKRKAKVPN